MWKPKYYDGIIAAQKATKDLPKDALAPFNLDVLGADPISRRIKLWLTDKLLPPILFLLREFWPVAKIGPIVIVTRYSDVRDVLNRPGDFEVPFKLEMEELAGGDNFVLGLDGCPHDKQSRMIRRVLGEDPGDDSTCKTDNAAPAKPVADHQTLMTACLASDDDKRVADLSDRFARALIRTSGGRIDVMKDYITRVATETCIRYFGLKVDDPDAFAEWGMSISTLLFGDPFGDPATRALALNGAARIRSVIDQSISVIDRSIRDGKAAPDTVLGRLIALKGKDPTLTNGQIRAIMVGLLTGFIPTNTLGAGKILQELLRRPETMSDAIRLARSARKIDEANRGTATSGNPDKEALRKILFEALRLNSPLTPGQWRYTNKPTHIGKTSIPADRVIMVTTMSAMRDRRRRGLDAPGKFRNDRDPVFADLAFGGGSHECLGKSLAMAQIAEIFVLLFSQANLRPSEDTWGSRIRWVGPFPRRLDLEFDPETAPATQTMVTVCAPLVVEKRETPIEMVEKIQAQIAALGNPAGKTIRDMLDETGIVHFASLSVIEAGDAKEPAPHLLLELNVDGSWESAVQSIAQADALGGGKLHAIFQNTPKGQAGLAEVIGTYVLDLQSRPWGAIGLNFNGTPEFPVADIEMQDALAKFARQAINFSMSFHAGFGNRAMEALKFVRQFMQNVEQYKNSVLENQEQDDDKKLSEEDKKQRKILVEELEEMGREAPRLKDYLIVPSRRQLKISDWKECKLNDAIYSFLQSWSYVRLLLPVIAIAVLFGVAIFFATAGATPPLGLMGRITLSLTGGPAAALILVALVVTAFVVLLRYHETRDIPDDENPKLADVRKIAGFEDPPGFVQNHFMAVTPLKSGWFRKLTLALSLWGIKQMVLFYFRPGFVLNMGTIHYAKWFRIPGRDKLVFQANYDGSWDSYLEDFIMKAHQGQTAAWCNGVGFPRTKFLLNEGAQDGDRFKRWVRRQQVIAHFWYSRFPHLTTDQIRNNALIHDGLARATTDSAARAWLDCFGSVPRPDYAIETDEVQSLVFRGQRYLPCATYALIRLPDLPAARKACFNWLAALENGSKSPHDGKLQIRNEGSETTDSDCEITFGDHPYNPERKLQDLETFVAFSAAGLKKLGLADPTKHDGLGSFPNTFNLGMANRGRTLGDFGNTAAANWRWADTDDIAAREESGRLPPAVDAVLLIYASTPAECRRYLDKHLALLGRDALVHEIPTQPPTERLSYDDEGRAAIKPVADEDDKTGQRPVQNRQKPDAIEHEHFGFRDGISQPVIRGTQRFVKRAHQRDIVEPGEFILGYRNNQGYYPPTATVRAESDVKGHLPTVLADVPSRFPSFNGGNTAARDFGRNGSFLVIRQLAQDVAGFKDFLEEKADILRQEYQGLPGAVGAPITAEWLAAKMMGRWPDGTPLIERPGVSRAAYPHKHQQESNNFLFGVDDPQGLRCPFGAHIRRANPRDSMQPEDPSQLAITNRHRLLRRGRAYQYEPKKDGETEKGLLFTCLCADLDRQYEFVQQTWLQSPSFHGLRDEPDPMVAWADPQKPRVFTIPTSSGPVRVRDIQSFVTVRAGGYFFLPSRSAIQHLVDINQPDETP